MLFDVDCTTPLAEQLINLYAQYVEGEIESSRRKYIALLEEATIKDIIYMIYRTPFERHALNLSKLVYVPLPQEVVDKLSRDAAWVNKMDVVR